MVFLLPPSGVFFSGRGRRSSTAGRQKSGDQRGRSRELARLGKVINRSGGRRRRQLSARCALGRSGDGWGCLRDAGGPANVGEDPPRRGGHAGPLPGLALSRRGLGGGQVVAATTGAPATSAFFSGEERRWAWSSEESGESAKGSGASSSHAGSSQALRRGGGGVERTGDQELELDNGRRWNPSLW